MSECLTVVGMVVHYYPPHAAHMHKVPPLHFSPRIGITPILVFVYVETK